MGHSIDCPSVQRLTLILPIPIIPYQMDTCLTTWPTLCRHSSCWVTTNDSPVGSLILSLVHHQWTLVHPSSSSQSSSSTPFLPAVDVWQVEVQVADLVEGVVCSRTTSDPAKIRTFPIRIGLTIGFMFSPTLFDVVFLITIRTDIGALIRGISTMWSFLVLLQPLGTSIFLTTNWALKLLIMNTGSCVSGMHPFVGKNLPTLTTWEFLTPVDPHMDHKVVVGLEGLLVHQDSP